MPDDLTDTIATNAAQPKKVKTDGIEVEQQSIQDQIAADNHAKAKTAVKQKNRGMWLSKIVPPGAK